MLKDDRRDRLFSWCLPLDHAKTVEEIPVAAAPHPMTVWPTR
jgi:hypothetical protein